MSVDLQCCCFSVGGIRYKNRIGYAVLTSSQTMVIFATLLTYVSVDIRKKRKVWFKYRDIYCSCTDPERFVRGGPTLTKVF